MQTQIDLQKIEQSSDFISGFDDQLNIVIWNEAIATKYNIPKAAAIGKNVLELFPHIADDFRLQCLQEAASEKKMFYFAALPYAHEDGIYSQLIIPGKEQHDFDVLSLVRSHRGNEHYLRTELLESISSKPPLMTEFPF